MTKGKLGDDFGIAKLTTPEAAQFRDLLAKLWGGPSDWSAPAVLVGTILEEWNASLIKMARANEAVVGQIAFRMPAKKPGRLGPSGEFRLPDTGIPIVEIRPGSKLHLGGAGTERATAAVEDADEPTEADWEEVRRRALEIVGANLLDAPERHLAYVRERIAGVLSGDV
jgi:hypothetical protein